MYGWRGRIGFISPAPIDSVAYEFYRLVPDGVVLVANSLKMQKITMENIENTLAATVGAARELADAVLFVIVVVTSAKLSPSFHCTTRVNVTLGCGVPVILYACVEPLLRFCMVTPNAVPPAEAMLFVKVEPLKPTV